MPRQAAADADKATPLIHWDMRADESSIGFKGVQTGDAFTGEFKSFTADIVFVPQNLALSTVKAVIDMSSFEAGNKDRNEALPGKNWFAVKDFPQAVFTTDDFTGLGDNNYEAKGQLTIRDVSLPVTLPFNLDISEDGVARMSGTLDIDRSDYGVGQGAWAKGEWVDLTVGIDIEIIADKRP
jgi:polyisoprenoid-binding protein YceI